MIKRLSLIAAILAVPALAFAQATSSITSLFTLALNFINFILVPLIFAVAFLFFIWGVYRYFIAGGGNEEKVKEGQKFVMWSIIGFVLMISVWGIINLFVNTLGFAGASMPLIPTFNANTSGGGTSILGNFLNGATGGGSGGGSTGIGSNGYSGNLFGGQSTYVSSGVSYPVIKGTNNVQAVNGTCPINFTEIANNVCQSVNANLGNGNLQPGASCTSDGQCEGDYACLPQNSPNAKCTLDNSLITKGYGQGNGTVVQGGTCKTSDDCTGNLICSGNDVCIVDSQLNGAGFAKGDGSVLQGGACATNNDCAGNLICDNTGTCNVDSQLNVGNGTLGSACQVDSQCDGNYQCLNAVCSQPTSLGQQGDACTYDSECYGNLACDPSSHTCQYDANLESSDTTNTSGNSYNNSSGYCCADGSNPLGTGSCNDGSDPTPC